MGPGPSFIVGPGPSADSGTLIENMEFFLLPGLLFDLVPLLLLGPGPCANSGTKVVKMKNIVSLSYCWTWSSRLCGT